MPLNPNDQLLVDFAESQTDLDGRYDQIKLVNYDSVYDQQRGCFSVVFRAFDKVEQKQVALKFYSLNPLWFLDLYRRASFEREHGILQTLMGKERCLQLQSSLKEVPLEVPQAVGPPVIFPCRYFAVDWIENDIDGYFLSTGAYPAIDKLRLFNEIVLAVEALHRNEVFHRDIKADNLRAYQKSIQRVVVAIDLGTAARMASSQINTEYRISAGAPIYAASEAYVGLAGNRLLAPYTDKYALGCLLYELFNRDFFIKALISTNPYHHATLIAMQAALHPVGSSTEVEQKKMWSKALARHGRIVAPVSICGPGHEVPPGIVQILDDLVMRLTHFDFSQRPSLEWTRRRLWSAIKALENQLLYEKNVAAAKAKRQLRVLRVMEKQAKLQKYIEAKSLPC